MPKAKRVTKKQTSKSILLGTGVAVCFAAGLVTWGVVKNSYWRKPANLRPQEQSLSQVDAELRAQQVSGVRYKLEVKLDERSADFSGKTEISFLFSKASRELTERLRIDLSGGTVDRLEVNGNVLARPQSFHTGSMIFIPVDQLIDGLNRVSIGYHHPYSNDGNGLHRFVDPEDGKVYLYTHFEPYNANRFFPCFDQPDLKATYEIEVDAPEAWEVISSRLGVATVRHPGEKHWSFPVSEKFSTYLISLHAGPYSKWESQAGSIPLRLFARQSLARYVDHEEWFDVTQRGLRYFPDFFGAAYPYGKYDQVIVPDFNPGAMENVAAVTFSENFVYRSRVTQVRKMGRADTILHEMAHMWFGNLVTMKWWNGLWLNESFATYMAHRAVAEATPFTGVWQAFFSNIKDWAYRTDNQVTTHPIEADVADTAVAMANFDGITYGKGASSLKQLAHLQGDSFRDGLRIYFSRFSEGNTSLNDFIQTQSEASGRDLSIWQRDWLTTTGMNTVQAEWSCEGEGAASQVTSFEMVQSPFRDNSVLRSHRTRVAFLTGGGRSPVQVASTEDVEYSAVRTEVPALIGKPCPSAVFPNYEDFDYVRVSLDEKSSRFVQENIGGVQNVFLRQMLWQTLWEMVTEAQLPARSYITAVLNNSARETDPRILGSLLRRVARVSGVAMSAVTLLPPEQVAESLGEIERVLKERMLAAAPGSDLQQIWFEGFLAVAKAPASVTWARSLLDSSGSLSGFHLGQDHRWMVIQSLARANHAEVDALIQAEVQRDPSDSGKKQSYAALSSVPREDTRQIWLARVLRLRDQSVFRSSELRVVGASLLTVSDVSFSRAAIQPFLDALPSLVRSEDENYLGDVSSSLTPLICEDEIIEKVGAYIEERGDSLPENVIRKLRIWKQDLETCRRVRQASAV